MGIEKTIKDFLQKSCSHVVSCDDPQMYRIGWLCPYGCGHSLYISLADFKREASRSVFMEAACHREFREKLPMIMKGIMLIEDEREISFKIETRHPIRKIPYVPNAVRNRLFRLLAIGRNR